MGEGKGSTMDSQLIPGRLYARIRIVLLLVFAGVPVCDSINYPALLLQFPGAALDQQAKRDVAWVKRGVMHSLLHLCDLIMQSQLSDYDKIRTNIQTSISFNMY